MIQSRKTEKRRERKGRVAAALAAVLLVTSVTAVTGLADDSILDLGTPCSITVTMPANSDESFDELDTIPLVFDVYKVASAIKAEGQNAYNFKWDVSDFKDLEAGYNALQAAAEDDTLTAEDVNLFTQDAAAVVLNGSPTTGPKSTTVENFVSKGMNAITVDPGLYLVTIHSVQEDYIEPAPDTDTPFTTYVDTRTKRFTFAPILVSVPNRGLKEIGSQNIAGNAEWEYSVYSDRTSDEKDKWDYSVEIAVKAGAKDQDGALKIDKVLTRYETLDNRTDRITFVYDVEAWLGDQRVYTNVASVVVSAAGTAEPAILTGIPVGAEVTVTEVYPGGNYHATSDNPQRAIIKAVDPEDPDFINQIAHVSFTNDYEEEKWNGSGSVSNHFEADKDGWVTDRSQYTKTYADNDGVKQEPLFPQSSK